MTEVEIMESVDYGDTDLRSVIEGDRRYNSDKEESYGAHGFSKQEFEGEELVDVEEEEAVIDFDDEMLEDEE
jgi:DNA-directed RNA polymerase subunit beta